VASEVALAMRALHYLAIAVVLGGTLALAVAFARGRPGALARARAYEAAFWGAAVVLVLSGVGNAGAFGPGLPGPSTPWGGLFLGKLLAVLLLLLASMVRTLLVALAARHPAPGARALAGAYGATFLLALVPLVAGVSLAHG
jgi:putative copper export protein